MSQTFILITIVEKFNTKIGLNINWLEFVLNAKFVVNSALFCLNLSSKYLFFVKISTNQLLMTIYLRRSQASEFGEYKI